MSSKPVFFSVPHEFREWLEVHHKEYKELWVGFYKTATGLPGMTWPESVDRALCFGWSPGIRKSLGEKSYMIRFTPRGPASIWSAVNIRKMGYAPESLFVQKRKETIQPEGIDITREAAWPVSVVPNSVTFAG